MTLSLEQEKYNHENWSERGIKTKTCGAKVGLKFRPLNPKDEFWQI